MLFSRRKHPTVVVVGKAWDAHVTDVLKTSLDENLAMVQDSVSHLKKEGREVIFDLEHFFDGWHNNREYALKVLKAATEAGANFLSLCDTNGGTLPQQAVSCIQDLMKENLAPLGVHFHNDTGCAVAASILSIEAGAALIQGTINGWGERVGNANLCAIIPNLVLKMGKKALRRRKI